MLSKLKFAIFFLTICLSAGVVGQGYRITGKVICDDGDVAGTAEVFLQNTPFATTVDSDGYFKLENIPTGEYTVVAYALEHQSQGRKIQLDQDKDVVEVNFHLHEFETTLAEVSIEAQRENNFGISRLSSVDGMGIYEGKKSEVLIMDDIVANKATNNARQVFSRVSGLNIWESDCAGIQLGVGGRGLSPNRSSNFNTRQNGVDMSADALGYPESYYSPPIQAVEKIEVVRGAASLQYGTQFGGLINFDLKDAPEDKPIEIENSLTAGSFNYFNNFTSVGGTVDKVSYYTYYQYRTGECWRENSDFNAHSAYGEIRWQATAKLSLRGSFTHMRYLAQQPGGLTDQDFQQNPRQSIRNRNWFQVNWNLPALDLNYRFSTRTQLNSRFFALVAGREALGNLERIDRIDPIQSPRTLIGASFQNIGNETRLLHRYSLFGRPGTVLTGIRAYRGYAYQHQGEANTRSGPDFYYRNSDSLSFEYDNRGKNIAVFAENLIDVTSRFSLTPGIRYEYIETESSGYLRRRIPTDLVGNPLIGDDFEPLLSSDIQTPRSFVLIGLGGAFRLDQSTEIYGNISQNYKSISYSDIRVSVPTLVIDSAISDESGYSADLGVRGYIGGWVSFDMTLFYLAYNDRIGSLLQRNDLNQVYRFRTNVGDARNLGIESFAEADILQLIKGNAAKASLNVFANTTLLHTEYIEAPANIEGNRVEFSPTLNLRSGVTWKWRNVQSAFQISYLSEQYSDATNASNSPPVPGAVEGTIPAYHVADFTASYSPLEWLNLQFSINNLTNNYYFTRRATGYPGPGIIPSDGRSFHLTLTGRF